MRIQLFLLMNTVVICFGANAQLSFKEHMVFDPSGELSAINVADIDGDGDMDIISSTWTEYSDNDSIFWYENVDGLGTYGMQKTITTNANAVRSVDTNDFDGDGDIDVVAVSYDNRNIVWYENTDGKGDFSSQHTIVSNEIGLRSVHSGDIDGDNDIDVISGSSRFLNDKITWHENTNGQGDFVSHTISTNEDATDLTTFDIDNDGDLDIIAASFFEGDVYWYENINGSGNFSAKKIISEIKSITSIYTADINNDNYVDVLISSSNDYNLVWLENQNGTGDFIEHRILGYNEGNTSKAIAKDLDNDGDIDVISILRSVGNVVWYENIDQMGDFSQGKIITSDISSPIAINAADIDGDNDIDIIASNRYDPIYWYENKGLTNNEINGYVTMDTNFSNCSSSNSPISNVMVTSINSAETLSTYTQDNGFYQLYPNVEGSYITFVLPNSLPDDYISRPTSYNLNFTGNGTKKTANFCVEADPSIRDLNISLIPLSRARPGFNSNYQLIYENNSPIPLSGQIAFSFDNSKLTFIDSDKPIVSQTNNTINFGYNNLKPFEIRTINLAFNVFAPPTVNIGDVLSFTANITPVDGDLTPDDNSFSLDQVVIGSYDPNDIQVLEGNTVFIDDANKYLHYLIRFQNTGTADAINVKVSSVLDSKLDWTTLQPESISHQSRIEINNQTQLSFIFDNIHLPDSTSNEPKSHGFISYKIKPKSNIEIGDIIQNKADIFFDFNPAIETNTVFTEIITSLGINDNTTLDFDISPNPTSNILYITSNIIPNEIHLFDMLGQKVLSNYNTKKIDVSNINRGLYLIQIIDDNHNMTIRKILKE